MQVVALNDADITHCAHLFPLVVVTDRHTQDQCPAHRGAHKHVKAGSDVKPKKY